MASADEQQLTPHATFSEFFPNVVVYTLSWSFFFLLFQHLLVHLPSYLYLTPLLPSWYLSIPPAKLRHYHARLLFSAHHLLVSLYALHALLTPSLPSMLTAMYTELACDLFDVAVIACTERGFTGLNYLGLLLHHLLSILAILTTFTLHTPLTVTAQLAILLDGTGATDYLFSTTLAHTPLIQHPAVLATALLTTLLFFLSRLFYFPLLAVRFVLSAFATHWLSGVVCAALMAGTAFFNLGMIRTRTAQYRALWKQVTSGAPSREERGMRTPSAAEEQQERVDEGRSLAV